MRKQDEEEIHLLIAQGYTTSATDPRILLELANRYLSRAHMVQERNRTRSIEREARDARRIAASRQPGSVQSIVNKAVASAWSKLLERSFSLENGQYVTWGDATIEQHRWRARKLDRKMVTIGSTRDLHLQAVTDLEKAGAETLRDLIGAAA